MLSSMQKETAEWPKSGRELKESGYANPDKARCKSCGKTIFFVTTPNGYPMPIEEVDRPVWGEPEERYWQSHFASCKDAKKWRKKH